MTSHPDMKKIRITGFFFENLAVGRKEKNSTNGCLRLSIYLRTNKILIRNTLYVFDNWGNIKRRRGRDADPSPPSSAEV
jgi:hypothetical protein